MRKGWLWVVMVALLASGCGKDKQADKATEKALGPSVVITVTQPLRQTVQALEKSVGSVESLAAPTIAAEVAGQVREVKVDAGQSVTAGQLLAVLDAAVYSQARVQAQAEVLRAQAALDAQQKQSERNRDLFKQKFISQAALDQSETQLVAARAQLDSANAALARAVRDVNETRVSAPFDGQVEQRYVSAGDYVTPGKPMFQLSTQGKLRVHLPFPETVADRIRIGQTVHLSLPSVPGVTTDSSISEIRPMIGSANRAFEAIVALPNPGNWKPGASVTGVVVTGSHPGLTVPSLSVVMRPAGTVVYSIENGKAVQKVVTVGLTQDGRSEILSGLQGNERIALDGAGFLSNGAAVSVKQPDAANQP